jgi:hypothetical protein
MRMRLLVSCLTTILLAGTAWAQDQPVCPPGCTCTCGGGDLVYECAKTPPDFVISDGAEVDLTAVKGVPANFSVKGLVVNNLLIGNASFPPFTIGDSNNSARFTTSDGGQCVGVSNFSGFVNPGSLVVGNPPRALTLLRNGAFFCKSASRSIICFQVKGQVGAPFPPNLACTPDRVEYACGTVM